jgi:hypothetical protein
MIPQGAERRLRFVAHLAQFIAAHLPRIAPNPMTVGPDFGRYINLFLRKPGHS